MKTTTGLAALCVASGMALAGPFGGADTETFLVPIPDIGQTFFLSNGIIPDSNAFDGGTVIAARLELNLTVFATEPGDPRESSAAHFLSQVLVPVDLDPAPGPQIPGIVISGANEGWSGTGEFSISRDLDELVGGTWVSPLFYSSVTESGLNNDQIVLGEVDFFSSFISVTVQIPAPGGPGVLLCGGLIAARRRR